jgi:seryl-tRNA synthetase
MSESQSRYSIVERLTEKKISLMKDKSALKNTVVYNSQKVISLKNDLNNWKKDVQEDIKRAGREKELEIEKANQELNNSKSKLSEQEKSYNEQIKAVEDALKSIEKISETAPSN